jgi:GTPase
MSTSEIAQRFGYITLLGMPNAGKSSLTNVLIGHTLCGVTAKPHTTRIPVLGLALHAQTQMALLDTAGILLKPKRDLEKKIIRKAWDLYQKADLVLFLVSLTEKDQASNRTLLSYMLDRPDARPVWVLFNKRDAVSDEVALRVAQSYEPFQGRVAHFDMISAHKPDSITPLKARLAEAMPVGPWIYPEEDLTSATSAFLAEEITRQWLLKMLHQELPYALHVATDSWKETNQGIVIHQTIFVTKESHKPIVLGKQGRMIRLIGEKARHSMMESLVDSQSVHLFLHVKVEPDWMDLLDTTHV